LRVVSIVCANLASLLYRVIAQLNLSVATTWHYCSITKICRENIALTSSYCFVLSLITFISLATKSRHRSIMPVVLAKILLQHRNRLFHCTGSSFYRILSYLHCAHYSHYILWVWIFSKSLICSTTFL